jgi:hypothetical protein
MVKRRQSADSEDADAPASRRKAHKDGDTRMDKKAAKESKKSKKRRKGKEKGQKGKKGKKERKKEQKAHRSSPSSASSSRSSGSSRDSGSDIGEENGQQLLGQKFSKVLNPEPQTLNPNPSVSEYIFAIKSLDTDFGDFSPGAFSNTSAMT